MGNCGVWCGVWFAETKTSAFNRQLLLLRQANVAKAPIGAMLDEFTTYQVDGSVVDYLASDG